MPSQQSLAVSLRTFLISILPHEEDGLIEVLVEGASRLHKIEDVHSLLSKWLEEKDVLRVLPRLRDLYDDDSCIDNGAYLVPLSSNEVKEDPWSEFTPQVINHHKCLARTWNNGRGGQCHRKVLSGEDFCQEHALQQTHGRVDGPIPKAKLAEFQKAAEASKHKGKLHEHGEIPDGKSKRRVADFKISKFARRKKSDVSVAPVPPQYKEAPSLWLTSEGKVVQAPTSSQPEGIIWSTQDLWSIMRSGDSLQIEEMGFQDTSSDPVCDKKMGFSKRISELHRRFGDAYAQDSMHSRSGAYAQDSMHSRSGGALAPKSTLDSVSRDGMATLDVRAFCGDFGLQDADPSVADMLIALHKEKRRIVFKKAEALAQDGGRAGVTETDVRRVIEVSSDATRAAKKMAQTMTRAVNARPIPPVKGLDTLDTFETISVRDELATPITEFAEEQKRKSCQEAATTKSREENIEELAKEKPPPLDSHMSLIQAARRVEELVKEKPPPPLDSHMSLIQAASRVEELAKEKPPPPLDSHMSLIQAASRVEETASHQRSTLPQRVLERRRKTQEDSEERSIKRRRTKAHPKQKESSKFLGIENDTTVPLAFW